MKNLGYTNKELVLSALRKRGSMIKSKLCSLVIATAIGSMAWMPMKASASDTQEKPVSKTQVEASKEERKQQHDAFEKKIQKANETWKSLSKEQKNEVYALLESEVKIEIEVLNKLVEYNILEQTDADVIGQFMLERLNDLKKNEDFPLFRQDKKKNHKSK